MISRDIITFEGYKPSPKDILDRIRTNTGLEIEDEDGILTCKLFRRFIYYEIQDSSIMLNGDLGNSMKTFYLLGATIWALIELGGEYDGDFLPHWSKLPWEKAKLEDDIFC